MERGYFSSGTNDNMLLRADTTDHGMGRAKNSGSKKSAVVMDVESKTKSKSPE